MSIHPTSFAAGGKQKLVYLFFIKIEKTRNLNIKNNSMINYTIQETKMATLKQV